jgi:glycosyltransferase involved in cell wall biosynthesis
MKRVDHARTDWNSAHDGGFDKAQSVFARGRRRLAEGAFRFLSTTRLAEYSICAGLPELRGLASAEQADWFIAHAQPALPAAAAAARQWKSKLAFDCEDILSETGDRFSEANRLIELEYLQQCDYVSATSGAMAEYLAAAYKIHSPTVLYNTFPLGLADGLLPPAQRSARAKVHLHWVSQTIGLDRGLQDAFAACAGMVDQIEIHLRGGVSAEHKTTLLGEAERHGVAACLRFHPRVDPDGLIRSMGEYDVGLALERPANKNYNLTVTNKIFTYMLGGLAVVATDTAGQREVMRQAPEAGILYPAGDTKSLRAALEIWIGDRQKLRQTQQASWDAARVRFCWELEQRKFLDLFERSTLQPMAT